ncbi:MAG: AraC family transcriptional regulator [Pseudomonadota bacterium]
MNNTAPLCEPVVLDPSTAISAEVVKDLVHEDAPRCFPHFHDAYELILFEEVDGTLHTGTIDHRLKNGDIVLIPSMSVHDFSLRAGKRDWTILHVDPGLVAELLGNIKVPGPSEPSVFRAPAKDAARLEVLFSWLADRYSGTKLLDVDTHLLAALLGTLLNYQAVTTTPTTNDYTLRTRLKPALELLTLHQHPSPNVANAAEACHLSRHYFSRIFKDVYGIGYAEYVQNYRLRQAARALSTSSERVAEIGYTYGFKSPAYFAAAFKSRFGTSPSTFRNRAQHKGQEENQ